MHRNPMFHKYADLLAVQGTTDIRIACLVLRNKITDVIAGVQESIVPIEMTPDMHPTAAGVTPCKQTSIRATVQGATF
jgi:hypothetical protein